MDLSHFQRPLLWEDVPEGALFAEAASDIINPNTEFKWGVFKEAVLGACPDCEQKGLMAEKIRKIEAPRYSANERFQLLLEASDCFYRACKLL